jgi:hypothetical protein
MSLRAKIVSCKNPAELAVNAETIAEMLAVIWDLQDTISARPKPVWIRQPDGSYKPGWEPANTTVF